MAAKQYGFFMDLKKCTGCKTCQLACKDYKNLPVDRNFRRVVEYSGGSWKKEKEVWKNDVFTYYVSVSCNHCDKPACKEACPVDAIYKDEYGYVLIDEEKCIGCESCASACPYYAPQIDKKREKMTRCDGCKDRVINEGKQPICVESCPLRALDYGPIDEIRKKYGKIAEVAPFPAYSQTKPNIALALNKNCKPVGDKKGSIANPLEIWTDHLQPK